MAINTVAALVEALRACPVLDERRRQEAAGLGATAMLVFMPFRGPRYARASVTFFAGLGKLLWLPRFRPALYGSGLIS